MIVVNNSRIFILNKFIKFLGISGFGWLIDFSIYCILIFIFFVPVFWANIFSAIPAVTLVFFVSVRKIFKRNISKIPLGLKYAIYICYTIILLIFVSMIGQWGHETIVSFDLFRFFHSFAPIFIKCCITGITVVCNFFMMRFLAESI